MVEKTKSVPPVVLHRNIRARMKTIRASTWAPISSVRVGQNSVSKV